MKRKYSWLALIIVLALALSACGGGGGGGSEEQPPATGGTETPSNEQGGQTEETGGEKPELRMLMQYGMFDPATEYTAKFITEATGYKVNYEMLPAENADEKLNLLVANKEEFDIMKLNAAQFYKLATSGALEPIDELLAAHGNHINNAIKPESWESATIDGTRYAIPETGSGIAIGEELVVRQDWMDELGLKTPTNTDELYEVLKTFKEKKNVIPLTGSKDTIMGDIAAAFGVVNEWNEVDGKLVHMAEMPELREFLAYMRKLYEEGLIDPELPINTAAKAIEKFSGGKAAMYKLAWWNAGNTISALNKNFPEAKAAVIPFLKNKDGVAQIGANAGTTWFIAIPKVSKHKEDAMKLLNAKLEPETFKEMAIGKEGIHHEVKDGKYYPILPKFNDDLNNGSNFLTGVDETNYPIYWQARVRKDPILQSYYEEFQKNAEGITVVNPMSFAPPLDAISKNKLKLGQMLNDHMLAIISGAESLDNYDKFLETWRAEGGADSVAQANEWYQSTK